MDNRILACRRTTHHAILIHIVICINTTHLGGVAVDLALAVVVAVAVAAPRHGGAEVLAASLVHHVAVAVVRPFRVDAMAIARLASAQCHPASLCERK